MEKRQFIRILRKYLEGKSTIEEGRFIESYYDLFEAEPGLEVWLNEEEAFKVRRQTLNGIWEKVQHQEQHRDEEKVTKRYLKIAKIAAVVVIIIASGLVLHWIQGTVQHKNLPVAENNKEQNKSEIHPGSNQAVLTLANGKQIPLNSVQNGSIFQQGNVQIVKRDSELLSYQYQKFPKNKGKEMSTEMQYNTISTPKGGHYQVVLSDGSKVWLNAASSLRFPLSFTASTRTVSISGEAYFEIAPDVKQPFIVKSGNTNVEVLGTHFNINAYSDRKNIRTTLVEGSVRIIEGNKSIVLKPGEQAISDQQTKEIKVRAVNVGAVLAWKNGLFYFDNTNIKEIMNEISRWYNINVVYTAKDLSNKDYNGTISRYSNIDSVLERLSLTGTVRFKIEGRTVVVMN